MQALSIWYAWVWYQEVVGDADAGSYEVPGANTGNLGAPSRADPFQVRDNNEYCSPGNTDGNDYWIPPLVTQAGRVKPCCDTYHNDHIKTCDPRCMTYRSIPNSHLKTTSLHAMD